MRRFSWWLVAALLGVSACSKPAGPPSADAALAVDDAPAAPAPAAKAADPAPGVAVGPSAPQLAYTYTAGVEAPTAAVPQLAERHAAACRQAGPAACMVTAAVQSRMAGGQAHAELTLQAEPGWLQRFRTGLAADVGDAHGRVVGTSTATEDLTRSLVDTEAALRAKTILQGRLEQLLANRAGKLEDLLKVEQELARVQGEIDAARSELAVMRGRVATSKLTVTYDSRPPLSAPGAWTPLAQALRGATGVFATSVGAVISLVAAAAPFAVLAALAAAAFLALRRRRRPPPSPPNA